MKNQFAKRLSDFLAEENITQKQFAETIGVSTACVSYWIKGKKIPTAENLYLIGEKFNISIDYLLGLKEF